MKNHAMPLAIAVVVVGLGLMSIGFNLNGNQANATPAAPVAFNAGPDLPAIVWYDFKGGIRAWTDNPPEATSFGGMLVRAWSDGTIEGKLFGGDTQIAGDCIGLYEVSECFSFQGWFVISSPNEGLNAAADINFDSRVNAEDLGIMLAAWGDAPRNDYPPSDCPLGLIP